MKLLLYQLAGKFQNADAIWFIRTEIACDQCAFG